MKRYVSILIIFLISAVTYAQGNYGLVFNKELFAQLLKNQTVRVASQRLFQKNLKKQSGLYKKIGNEVVTVIAIQEWIHWLLTNVNVSLRQGKKLHYFIYYLNKIGDNGNKLLNLTTDLPQYAILYTNLYNQMLQECLVLFNDLNNVILKEDKNFLMDPYDREILLEKMLTKVRTINGYLIVIIAQLKEAKKIAYYKQLPVLSNYIVIDQEIVHSIINKWKMFE